MTSVGMDAHGTAMTFNYGYNAAGNRPSETYVYSSSVTNYVGAEVARAVEQIRALRLRARRAPLALLVTATSKRFAFNSP